MKLRSLLPLALSLAGGASFVQAVPTEIARESFEGGGSIGFTTQVAQFEVSAGTKTDYFKVVPNDGTKVISGVVTGGDGSFIFAGEDIDTLPQNNPPTLSVTLNPVNISGKTNLSVKFLLAAPGSGASQNFYDHSATASEIDFVRVEASIDGGPFNRLIQYSPTTAAPTLNAPLGLDSDGDGLANPSTADLLGTAFRDFSIAISTGSTVQVRVVMHSNATNEPICFDNIRIFGESPATAPPALAGVPTSTLTFNEGSAATALAPAITVTDSDSSTLTSATVVISQNLTSGEDVLAATPSGAILPGDISYTSATGTLSITRTASLADYQAVLRSVTYRNTNTSNPNVATRQISFSTTDGVNASNSPIRQVDIVDNIGLQSLPFTESFETDGRGTRYALDGRFTNGSAKFDRQTATGVTNLDGTFAILAEDTLLDGSSTKAVRFLLNTAPFGSVTATVRLGTVEGAVFDTNDFVFVEASVNGGAFSSIAAFQNTGGLNTPLALDTNNDGTGDSTQLSTAMQDFVFNMPAASTLGLRVRCQSNATGERIVVDRIFVQGTAINYSINDASASESTGTRTFTVTRSTSSGADTISYAAVAGSATEGSDFSAATGTVSFADGETTKPITITIQPDSIVELDEQFTVVLSNPSRGTITDDTGIGSITNDDASVISLTGGVVTEGDSGTSSLSYTYTLSNPVDTVVSFNRSTLSTGTATSGTDFTAISNQATSVPVLSTTGNFTITVLGDNLPESTETVPVELSSLSAGGRAVTFAGGAAVLTASGGIQDDDPLLVGGSVSLGLKIGVSGKMTIASLLSSTTGGEGHTLSFGGVQSGPTAQGGTVTIIDGWVHYIPAPGFSGADSFTFSVSDGFQTVNGTVNVIADNGIGQSQNIVRITNEGDGKRAVALGIPGRTYQWQISANLNTWANLGSSAVCPNSGVLTVLDPGPLPPTRFYRLIQIP